MTLPHVLSSHAQQHRVQRPIMCVSVHLVREMRGSLYTALAALALMGALEELPNRDGIVQWCAARQVGGFQGRPNKDEDTCYSFWIGATLALQVMHAAIRQLRAHQPLGATLVIGKQFQSLY